ncbi:putative amino acid aldolase or racemase [Streptomyces noursei ATCC 11455]|nr:putative amino acid aldolase or racemase [Streptomyces noursei ATCC 11455]
MAIPLPDGLVTPALVVDPDVLDRNFSRMAEASRSQGSALRPHAKSHWCAPIADRQLRAAGAGCRWRLGNALHGSARPVEVLVEVDSGSHRTGVQPHAAGEVGKAAADAGLDVVGVFTFPGHGYGHDAQARERVARDEERMLGEAAQALQDLGLDIRVVSGGSTPTVGQWQPGAVNELRPGVYVFNDATQLAIGTCEVGDLALVAAATVISVSASDRSLVGRSDRRRYGSTLPTVRLCWPSGSSCAGPAPG